MKNRKMNPAALAAALIGAAALFGAAGCDDGSSPKLCTCPNGTIHENFGCECGGVNCVCTHTLYHLELGITLEDQTGGALTEEHINETNRILVYLKNDHYSDKDFSSIKIIIVTGQTNESNGAELTVGLEHFSLGGIEGIIDGFLYSYFNSAAFMFDTVQDPIRLADGEPPDDAASVTHFSPAKAPGHAAAPWTAPVPLLSAAGGEAEWA